MSGEAPSVLVNRHEVSGADGHLLEIVLNRAAVHNCVDADSAKLLREAWLRFRDDASLTVAILRGAGDKAFCSGADLAGIHELRELSSAILADGPMGGTRLVQHKPVITVNQGYAYAGGLELFCHGHIRLAERQATFSVACRRWGVPLVDGGTVYLPRLLGWGSALPLIITGQRIDADRAFQIGMVWEVLPTGTGVERAFEIGRQLCLLPRDAMLADLRSAIRNWHLPLELALKQEADNLEPVMTSESTRKGVLRFLAGERSWFR